MHMCFNDKGKDINVFIHVYEICMHMLKDLNVFTNVFEEMFY